MGGGERERGAPSDTAVQDGDRFKDSGKEGVGTSPGDENLPWAYSAPNPESVPGVPTELGNCGACHNPQEKEER